MDLKIGDIVEFKYSGLHGIGEIYSIRESDIYTKIIKNINGYREGSIELQGSYDYEVIKFFGIKETGVWVIHEKTIKNHTKLRDYD